MDEKLSLRSCMEDAGCAEASIRRAEALLDIGAFEASRAAADLFRWNAILLAAVLYAAMKKFSFHPVVFLAASAVVGIVFRFAGA